MLTRRVPFSDRFHPQGIPRSCRQRDGFFYCFCCPFFRLLGGLPVKCFPFYCFWKFSHTWFWWFCALKSQPRAELLSRRAWQRFSWHFLWRYQGWNSINHGFNALPICKSTADMTSRREVPCSLSVTRVRLASHSIEEWNLMKFFGFARNLKSQLNFSALTRSLIRVPRGKVSIHPKFGIFTQKKSSRWKIDTRRSHHQSGEHKKRREK